VTRHSHEDALSEAKFEALIGVTDDLDPPADAECYVLLLLGGRLGMRAGEIAHMQADWIDWERKQIQIPSYENCTKGRGEGVCGYCRSQAKQAVGYRPDELMLEGEMSRRWKPKTDTSARTVPFDFSERIELCLREFFAEHDAYPHSRASMNRRMDQFADAAGIDREKIYPRCLRATAATYHAYRGLAVVPLQATSSATLTQTPARTATASFATGCEGSKASRSIISRSILTSLH
jgi:integrase